MAAGAGAFVLDGQDADLYINDHLNALPGAFVLAGQDAQFRRGRVLVAGAGAFVLDGQDAQLVVGQPSITRLRGRDLSGPAYLSVDQSAAVMLSRDTSESYW
jgi:hypothetical protein